MYNAYEIIIIIDDMIMARALMFKSWLRVEMSGGFGLEAEMKMRPSCAFHNS